MVHKKTNGVKVDELVHRHPEVEHFVNLNTILLSLVDFIRPETFVAQDDLQTFTELKEKFLRESAVKRKKQKQTKTKDNKTKSPLEVAGVQSIRTTSGIYRFLAHHHKNNPLANGKKPSVSLNRDELLKKLHDKMPHRQQTEDQPAKRKRTETKSTERPKKPRPTMKEWSATPTGKNTKSSAVPTEPAVSLTFGRFEFGAEKVKHEKKKHIKSKKQQLVGTLKKVEFEQEELARLQKENPEEGDERRRSKHWQSALAKAKGEKVRDNVQLLRKSIKKQDQRRQQSAKKWQEKKSQVDKRMKEKQDKRKTNLQKRKDEKKAKLKKKLIKKGRLVS